VAILVRVSADKSVRLCRMSRRRVGLEEELLLVHPDEGIAVPGFNDVRDEALRRRDEPAEHELKQEQAEIASAPFTELRAIRADLRRRRDNVQAAARARGMAAAATGTSPLAGDSTLTEDDRYARMERRFGMLERQQLTCGMHVHVSINSPAEGVAAIDRIRVWLPVLVALSANSPFWSSQDTGYASYRSVLWGQWPTAGPTEVFGALEAYQRLLSDLLGSGTILDEGMVYFDARLSRHYPTVEIRVADVCTELDDAVTIGAICRALVDTAVRQYSEGHPPPAVRSELLRVASWGASRYGVNSDLVDTATRRPVAAATLLDQLLDEVRAALIANDDLDLVRTGVSRVLEAGTGADRQRQVLHTSGQFASVVRDIVSRT
jgi:carboxylate-amine ligase